MSNPIISSWYIQLPNFLLAAVMYTLLGRALLGLIVDPDSKNYIWRFFCHLTDPIVVVFAFVTPKAAPPVVLWLFCFVWMFWIRVAFLISLVFIGATPQTGG
jgi:hypothetical protein